jgi:hypothetical protein
MDATFRKAERSQTPLKIALTGPSGSGKTYSALLIASGLGGRIAVVDTENASASLYAGLPGMPEFDVLEIEPPYGVEKYVAAIEAALAAKYDVLVVDSLTHAWAGEGGLLSQKETLDSRGGNSYTNWATITKSHEHFRAWLLKADIHLIGTMRSKQDYIVETNDKGKQAPRKVGLAPIQRDGLEYEFTTVLDLAMDHSAASSKDRTGLFDRKIIVPSVATGRQLIEWHAGGKPVVHGTVMPPVQQPGAVAPEAPATNGGAVKPNKWGGVCTECSVVVEAGKGVTVKTDGGWIVKHNPGACPKPEDSSAVDADIEGALTQAHYSPTQARDASLRLSGGKEPDWRKLPVEKKKAWLANLLDAVAAQA